MGSKMLTEMDYIRDGRSPVPDKEVTSRIMSRIKSKNTQPEILFRKALWLRGIRGYRLHWKKISGHPDLVFVANKVAIFINGCYWHRCAICSPPFPKTHIDFWTNKFSQNLQRDRLIISALREMGWQTLTFWECEIRDHLDNCIDRLRTFINK
jgi:DNA mismatch endonuclease (patch repair protein)